MDNKQIIFKISLKQKHTLYSFNKSQLNIPVLIKQFFNVFFRSNFQPDSDQIGGYGVCDVKEHTLNHLKTLI